MSRPDPATILPISDIDHSRDASSKLRLAGIVTSICPINPSLITLSDPFPATDYASASILVDLSLCTDQSAGWKRGSLQCVPPELKSMLMVIGHLTKRDNPVDIGFLTATGETIDLGEPQIRSSINAFGQGETAEELVPNRWFVLEAMLVKPLDHTFDLRLWNRAARLRSQHEWQLHSLSSRDAKGKRKAID
ncbi:uncharacterized protein UTRI_01518_B [Ustilago trichophora]|uniref:Uncharacterized protein n=1 Tax=Ustilago trichophora TaxID=86804 RepID=A0A5C3E606_9BASI|nr:uncharacterized protein UTRI_01518_B [Ustilago trichophora]